MKEKFKDKDKDNSIVSPTADTNDISTSSAIDTNNSTTTSSSSRPSFLTSLFQKSSPSPVSTSSTDNDSNTITSTQHTNMMQTHNKETENAKLQKEQDVKKQPHQIIVFAGCTGFMYCYASD